MPGDWEGVETLLSAQQLHARVQELGAEITADYAKLATGTWTQLWTCLSAPLSDKCNIISFVARIRYEHNTLLFFPNRRKAIAFTLPAAPYACKICFDKPHSFKISPMKW